MTNKDFPLISIVVLNYNGVHYLKQTVQGLLGLNYPNYEVIVVDNGSSDGSLEFLKEKNRIRLVSNINNSYSGGKNLGVSSARGEYVLLLDNDILIQDPFTLNNLIESVTDETGFLYLPVIDNGVEMTGYYGVYFSFYGVNYNLPKVSIETILDKQRFEIGAPDGKNMFFKKSVWMNVGGFDVSQTFNLDDMDIGPRVIIFGYRNYLCGKSFLVHLGVEHQGNLKYEVRRFKTLFSGHARSMIKNYQLTNLLFRFPFLYAFHCLKAMKSALKCRSLEILLSFFESNLYFMKNFRDTLKERVSIQGRRVVRDDYFLAIKPPVFK